MVCFSAGYILPDLRKLTLYPLNEAFIRGRSASTAVSRHQVRGPSTSAEKNCRSESAVDRDRCPHNTGGCAVVALLLPMPPAQDQKTEPKPKSQFLAKNRTETDRP